MKFSVKVDMTPVREIVQRMGLTPDGPAQQFLTSEVSRRMNRYMPHRSGAMEKGKIISDPHTIVILSPYAHYQWEGRLMVDPVTGSAWSKPEHGPKVYKQPTVYLDHDRGINPEAGPHFDRRLMAAEGEQIGNDLAAYIMRREKK